MTTPRKKKTSKEVAVVAEASMVPVDTNSIEIVVDPSLLYPPVPASKAVHLDTMPVLIPDTTIPSWKQKLYYAPLAFGAVVILIAIIALAL